MFEENFLPEKSPIHGFCFVQKMGCSTLLYLYGFILKSFKRGCREKTFEKVLFL
jgi:hypothetical protein